MGRRCMFRVPMSFTIDQDVAEKLLELPKGRRSVVVNDILHDHIGRIGDATEEDQEKYIQDKAKERVKKALSKLVPQIVDEILKEGQDE